MADQFKKDKKLSRQLKKLSSKLVEKAVRELGRRSSKSRGEGVHNARKRLKQLRGILRLVQHGISQKSYRRENRAFRNAGRPLSDVRDADIMIETLDQLIVHFSHQVKAHSFRRLRRILVERRRQIRKQLLEKERSMGKISASLRKAERRIKNWTSISNDYKILMRGVESTYAQGKNEMDTALTEKSDETLHTWRKSVKYLRYQL
ncbi:MAG: hypothetical protein C5B54_00040, partial [Acidobacteria bacterium]